MASKLAIECERAAARARTMQIRDFRYSLEGEVVTIDGEALNPFAIDTVGRLFAQAGAREVRNRVRHAPPDPLRPGALYSGSGYVKIVEMGPHAARLAESIQWEVRPGDTLATIAEAVYGDAAQGERVANANRAALGPESRLSPGMRLKIPPR